MLMSLALVTGIVAVLLHCFNAYVWFIAPEARKVVSGVVAAVLIVGVIVKAIMGYF